MHAHIRIYALVIVTGCTAGFPGSVRAQEHRHNEPTQAEMDSLREAWDIQYLQWQQELARCDEVRPGMVVADLGAGRGDLAVALAERVGPDGHVYANDIDPRMIEILNRRRREDNLSNVTVIMGTQNNPLLPRNKVEVAFLLKVYHQLEDKVGFLRTTMEELKPGAMLFIVDVDVNQEWGEGSGSVSDPEDAKADALAAGYEIVRLEWFMITEWKLYLLVVRKPAPRYR